MVEGGQGVARRKKEKIKDDEGKKIGGQIPEWLPSQKRGESKNPPRIRCYWSTLNDETWKQCSNQNPSKA